MEARILESPIEGSDIEVPFTGQEAGTLSFSSGASHLTLTVDAKLPHLLRASFRGPNPTVRVDGGRVSMRYELSFSDWMRQALLGGSFGADVVLKGSVPWVLECRGGASSITADLREARVAGVIIKGGASDLDLRLPRPTGVVPVRIVGGVSRVTVRKPRGVAVELEVTGGASSLELDEQRFGAVGGGLKLKSGEGPDRYEIEVMGGASSLSVRSEG